MLILPQKVKLKWSNAHKKYYENKGYIYTRKGNEFYVDIRDLKLTSKIKIDVICDYCNEVYHPTYDNYLKSKNNIFCQKDCCKKCAPLKQKEVNMKKYGVESTNSLKSVINKKREKMIISEDVVKQAFNDCGYIMLSKYINSEKPIEFICTKHFELGVQTTTYRVVREYHSGCKECRYEKIRGENHYNWNGGITELNIFLRDRMKQWTFDSLKNSDFKCDITNKRENLVVHHLHNFSDIVKETLTNLNLKILKKVTDYSVEDLKRIIDECTRLHYYYGLGVTLTEELHKEFHKIYGTHNNTKKQYLEFKNSKLLNNAS